VGMNFNNPYSLRSPVVAGNLVATSQPIAAQVGLRILQQGGNAVDAAIATAAALAVVEPVSNGLGSDASCIVWDGQELHALNATGVAPGAWTVDYFKQKHNLIPKRGMDSVTVPGAVAGWVALSQKFGRLPFEDLLEPAAEIAERGYLVPVVVQRKWAIAAKELQGLSGFNENFLPKGRAPTVGELVKFPAAARGLRSIAKTLGESFYSGEIAQAIERFSNANGGAITVKDFEQYRPEWTSLIEQNYRGYTLHEMPPSSQGVTALMALGILEHFDLSSMDVDSADSQHLQIEAIKLAFTDTYRYVADPSAMSVTTEQMLDPAYLRTRAESINRYKAQHFGAGNLGKGGTVYLTTADKSGMMVSFIQSNYMGFGSGCVEPEFGISLQNRGYGFSLTGPNSVEPGKRPFHTIVPAFLTQAGKPVMSFGVMGANMQPQGHVQTLVRMLDYKQNPQAACDAPRWCYNAGLKLNVESGMNPKTLAGLRLLGHDICTTPQDFGAGQFIWRTDVGYVAASDSRRDGLAAGY
jgi:gamma-glutamyltranspeptidase/glutathione hydrolase